jgi:beta-phosphoglucomutase-like phosphatase (HAD superfamily)
LIKAFIFDLDGTLVQTEVLKAKSYAKAAVELNPELTEAEVVEGFKDFAGLSRKEVAEGLLNRFDLKDAASERMKEFNVTQPWQAFVDIRMDNYYSMISDPVVLKEHLCPYNMTLLNWAKDEDYAVGLGTMSHRREAFRVLEILDIKDKFDFIATIQDVEHGKPDPEIYNLISEELKVPHDEALAVEDSSSGIKAALAAHINCVAVPSDFTIESVRKLPLDPMLRIVENPPDLLETAKEFIKELDSLKEKVN